MATTLVVNPGSSSKKYALYVEQREVLHVAVTKEAAGKVRYAVRKNGSWLSNDPIAPHAYATVVEQVLVSARSLGCITTPADITHVAVRVVAPGTELRAHQVIDDVYISRLKECADAVPLHIPPALEEIAAVRAAVPDATVVAASDTAFHSTIPDHAARYSIPEADAEAYDIRRYGYHGLSVASVVRRVHAVTGENPGRMIVCHLGSGASVTAVKQQHSIDTSMGFAPGSGLPMATRAGEVESGAVLELMRRKRMSVLDTYTYLQTQGGLQALAGEADFRHVLERYACQDEAAVAALTTFAYHVKKYIGAYMTALGGVDSIVFTATAAERSSLLRALCVADLEDLGIMLDEEKNAERTGKDGTISSSDSAVKVVVIRTDEMGEMMRVAEAI